jgi:hypothetical protein
MHSRRHITGHSIFKPKCGTADASHGFLREYTGQDIDEIISANGWYCLVMGKRSRLEAFVVLRFLETFWIRPSVHRQFSQGAGEAEDFRALASRKRTTSHTWGRVIALDALQIPRDHLRHDHDRSLRSRKLLTELQLLVCTLSGSANIDNNHIQQHEGSNSIPRNSTGLRHSHQLLPLDVFFFHGATSGSSKIAIPRTIVSSLSGTKYHENMAGSS